MVLFITNVSMMRQLQTKCAANAHQLPPFLQLLSLTTWFAEGEAADLLAGGEGRDPLLLLFFAAKL